MWNAKTEDGRLRIDPEQRGGGCFLSARLRSFILFHFLFSIFYLQWSIHTVCAQEQWQELKSEHFIVYYEEGASKKFAEEVASKSETYYKSIASELGYQRYSGFWTWENRVKIYIYPNKESFLNATGQNRWSEGMADYTHKAILSYAWHEGFLDALLPHEMTHLIFRDFVGFKGEVPLWMDEGVAQWMEPRKRELLVPAMRNLIQQNNILSLKQMMRLDVRQVKDPQLVQAFYVEAASLVGFLIRNYGPSNFILFCRQLRDGKDVEEALAFTYSTTVRDIDKLEEKWLAYYGGVRNDQ